MRVDPYKEVDLDVMDNGKMNMRIRFEAGRSVFPDEIAVCVDNSEIVLIFHRTTKKSGVLDPIYELKAARILEEMERDRMNMGLPPMRQARPIPSHAFQVNQSSGDQKVDPMELAEEVVSLLCSDILREISTTGHLTTATYEMVTELSIAHGALMEMIGVMHPEVSIEQLAEGVEPQEKADAAHKAISMQAMIDELNIWKDAYCGCRGLLMEIVRMLARSPLAMTSMISTDEKTVQRVMRLIASPHAVADILTVQVNPERREEFSNTLAAEMRISGWPEADVSDADA